MSVNKYGHPDASEFTQFNVTEWEEFAAFLLNNPDHEFKKVALPFRQFHASKGSLIPLGNVRVYNKQFDAVHECCKTFDNSASFYSYAPDHTNETQAMQILMLCAAIEAGDTFV